MLASVGVATDKAAVFLYLGVVVHPPTESHLEELLNMQISRIQPSLTEYEFLGNVVQSSKI